MRLRADNRQAAANVMLQIYNNTSGATSVFSPRLENAEYIFDSRSRRISYTRRQCQCQCRSRSRQPKVCGKETTMRPSSRQREWLSIPGCATLLLSALMPRGGIAGPYVTSVINSDRQIMSPEPVLLNLFVNLHLNGVRLVGRRGHFSCHFLARIRLYTFSLQTSVDN